MFELSSEATGPSICHVPVEGTGLDWDVPVEAGPNFVADKGSATDFRKWPSADGSRRSRADSRATRHTGVRFRAYSSHQLFESGRASAFDNIQQSQTAAKAAGLRKSGRVNECCRPLHSKPVSALSLLHNGDDLPLSSKHAQKAQPSQPEAVRESKVKLKERVAVQERGPNLFQNLAKISIPWLRYSRFSIAQSRAMMRNIPLLERAGLGALAGGLAGGFTNATLHPIDTVKTKLQAKGGTAMYTGAWDVVGKVLAKQGIAGFYRGLPAAVVGSVPSSAVYFGTYELGKELLLRVPPFSENRLAVPPFAATIGNIASSAFLVPKEVVKQRLQTGAVGTARAVFVDIVREEGVKGLYKGYSAALLRNVPSNVISFSTFEYLKAAWLSDSDEAELQPWQSLISGAVAGMLSAAATTPLDVVKTRIMTEARQAVSLTGATGKVAEAVAKAQFVSAFTPSGVVSTLKQISSEEGFKGLVRGAGPRILYGGCFSAMGFLSFETAKHILLEKYLRGKEREGLGRGRLLEADEAVDCRGVLRSQPELSGAVAGSPRLGDGDRLSDGLQGAAMERRRGDLDPGRGDGR